MTDQTTYPQQGPQQGPQPGPYAQPPAPPRRRGRRILFGLFLVAVAAVAGGIAGKAATGGFRHHYAMRGFSADMDPARIEQHADRIVRRVAEDVDASYEQQDKLRAVAKAAVRDLVPLAERARFARREGRGLLTQPNLDRAGIEKFRTEQMALADAFSKRLAQALADANEILTVEQRRKIADLLPPHQRRWGWHRG